MLSSDSQPIPESAAVSRWCSSRSTAMSASLTGDDSNLVQLLIGAPNIDNASAPASRTAATSRVAASSRSTASVTGNGHALDPQCWRIGAIAEDKIVRRREACEHFRKMSGNRDFADRIRALAALDPESRRAAAVISGHQIDA